MIDRNARGIFHGCCEGAANWYEIAKKVLELTGNDDVAVTPITSEEYNSPAKRPKYSVMGNMRLKEMGYQMLGWEVELARMFKNKKKIVRRIRDEDIWKNGVGVVVAITNDLEYTEMYFAFLPSSRSITKQS